MENAEEAARPTPDELREAFQSGYRSIDDGLGFYHGFETFLGSLGYRRRDEGSCTCPDRGWHGHMPECRWVRIVSTPR